jgi:DNA-binding PadR family transcriptional regulator
MAPKDSKKRKTNDSSESAKTSAVTEKKVESQQDSMSDDESADSLVEDSRSKMEKKELKELLKNYLIGRKLLNINIDMAKPKRHQLFDSLEEQGLVEVAKHKTVTIKSYRLTEKGINKATPPEFKEDMARTPKTDEDLHEIIKKYLYHPETGAKMFDILLEKTREHKTVAKKELAQMLGTNPSSPNFFYRYVPFDHSVLSARPE